MIAWPAAPHVAWARTRPAAKYDLGASDLLAVMPPEWPGLNEPVADGLDGVALDATLTGTIAGHCGVGAHQVVTAVGASGANFFVRAALVRPGNAVVVEAPGQAPLAAAARLVGAHVITLPRRAERRYAVEPEAIAEAITPRTRLVVVTRPHNPTGALIDTRTLEAIAEVADRARIHVLVEEVYLDTLGDPSLTPAATVSDRFISTSSLTKAYGLVALRCGWALAAPGVAARIRAASAVVAMAGRDDVAWIPPAGGAVAFPPLLRVTDADAFVDRLLVDHDTAVVPGRSFGHPQPVRVAFGFGMGAEELARGLDGLTAALDAAAHPETVRS